MPDFTYEVFFHCDSAESWSVEVEGSGGNKYTVRWDSFSHKNRHEVEHDYSCTCMAYKTRKGYCKHIKQVVEDGQHCKWLQFTDGGEPVKKDDGFYCPRCGRPAHAQRWAV